MYSGKIISTARKNASYLEFLQFMPDIFQFAFVPFVATSVIRVLSF